MVGRVGLVLKDATGVSIEAAGRRLWSMPECQGGFDAALLNLASNHWGKKDVIAFLRRNQSSGKGKE